MKYAFNNRKIEILLKKDKKANFKRINLHKSMKNKVQSMIMLYSNKLLSPPHYTKNSDEFFSLLYGKINCYIFNKSGKLLKINKLNKNNNYLILKKNTIHTFKIISSYAAAHEVLQGPFKQNNVYIPTWYLKNKSYYDKIISK